MKTFVIAYLSLHEGTMEMWTVAADNVLDAYKKAMLPNLGQEFVTPIETAEDFEDQVFDLDGYISALEIFC